MACAARYKIMERNTFREKIVAHLVLIITLALFVWGVLSCFTSPLGPILKNKQDTTVNFLILTKPAMLISYNPSLQKGVITNFTDKETALPLEQIIKQFKIESTPYIFVPQTQDRQKFWNNFKTDLSIWPKKPYVILSYLYSYVKMRLTKKTFISVGDFILLSYELPHLRGVDFTVREEVKTKKQKAKKITQPQPQQLTLENKKQEENSILVVEVLNASDHNGLAADVTRYLQTLSNEGIFKVDVIHYTTSPERLNTSKIISLTKHLEPVKELSKHLGLINKEIHYMEDKDAISDARIYIGEDFKLPKGIK